MKKLANLKPGAYFFYGGVQWVVLENNDKILGWFKKRVRTTLQTASVFGRKLQRGVQGCDQYHAATAKYYAEAKFYHRQDRRIQETVNRP